jgi:hypothetical protein
MWKVSKYQCRIEQNKFSLLNDSFIGVINYYLKDYSKKYPSDIHKEHILSYFKSRGQIEKCFQEIVDTIVYYGLKKKINKKELIKKLQNDYRRCHYSNGSNILIEFIKTIDYTYGYNENKYLPIFQYSFEIFVNYYEMLFSLYMNVLEAENFHFMEYFQNTPSIQIENSIQQLQQN